MTASETLTDQDRRHLHRCLELAREALEGGDKPFGSILIDEHGVERFADRNRVVSTGDRTRHPEFEIARWAASNLSPAERAAATVYTSGEHCPMCSAAHAWAGLGRIVYATSAEQLAGWHAEWGIERGPVAPLAINSVAPLIPVTGPDAEVSQRVRELHARFHGIS